MHAGERLAALLGAARLPYVMSGALGTASRYAALCRAPLLATQTSSRRAALPLSAVYPAACGG